MYRKEQNSSCSRGENESQAIHWVFVVATMKQIVYGVSPKASKIV